MPDLTPSTDDAITLTWKRYAQQFTVSEDLLLDIDVAVQRDLFGSVAYQFRTRILADDLPPHVLAQRTRVAYEVPTSTWQMWKKRHARRWYARRLVARWPVRYGPDPDGRGTDAVCTFVLERYRAYPRARVRLPEAQFGAPVRAHSVRDVRWSLGEEPGV